MADNKIFDMLRTLNEGPPNPLSMSGRVPAVPAPLLDQQASLSPDVLDLLLGALSGAPGNNLAGAVGGPSSGLGVPEPVLPQQEQTGGGFGLPQQPQYDRMPGVYTPPFMPEPNMQPYGMPTMRPRNTKQLALAALATAFVGRKERKRKKKAYEYAKMEGKEKQKAAENLAERQRVA